MVTGPVGRERPYLEFDQAFASDADYARELKELGWTLVDHVRLKGLKADIWKFERPYGIAEGLL